MIKNKTLYIWSALIFIGAFSLALWSAGLLNFVENVGMYAQPAQLATFPQTDAIIVLTGGSERMKKGIALLNAKKGKKLLISGVYPGVKAKHILHKKRTVSPAMLKCCVVLGHAAEDTRGNAQEAHDFMKAEGFKSMQLVTSHYHMPRSLLLFRNLMSDVKIIPHPVLPEIVALSSWWKRPGTRHLLIAEYHKYIFVQFRLWLERL